MGLSEHYCVLIIDDDPGDADLVAALGKQAEKATFEFVHTERLENAIPLCRKHDFDVVLLDLSLPDSFGLETVKTLAAAVRETPIIVVTGLDENVVGLSAIQEGAQDYIPKNELNQNGLARSIRYSVERFRLVKSLRELSMTDNLTGLKNRRGFVTFTEQALSLADRTKRSCVVLYGDVDGLKVINDAYGHEVGDAVLRCVGQTLRDNTRTSDIVSRIGGDEFAILMMDAFLEHSYIVTERISKKLKEHRAELQDIPLSVSLGRAVFDPHNPVDIEALLSQADTDMYEQKKSRR